MHDESAPPPKRWGATAWSADEAAGRVVDDRLGGVFPLGLIAALFGSYRFLFGR
jgi:hypothetical protein